MACTNCGGDAKTFIEDGDGVTFSGAGTATSPYRPHLNLDETGLAFEVRDSPTINLTLFGSGVTGDPLILTGDTGSAAALTGLSDVSSSVTVAQGRVPMWIGSPTVGQFEFRLPGTRYTTHAGRGTGLYQGEQIKETDTGDRFEWDGSQYVSLNVTSVPASSLDASVVQSKGTIDGSINWNSLVASAIYRAYGAVTSSNNSPSTAYGFGTLLVINSGTSVTQTYFAHGTPSTNPGRVYSRTKYGATDWTPWAGLALSSDVSAEVAARQSAVATVQNNITAEVNARVAALGNYYTKTQTDNRGLAAMFSTIIGITSGGGSRNSLFVPFPAGRFSSPPNGIQVTASTATPDNCSVGYKDQSTSGVTVWLSRDDTSGGAGILTQLSVTATLTN